MSTIYAEQHKLCPSHQRLSSDSKKPFNDFLEIPPRKLLSKKTLQENPDMSLYEANLHKFLPCNDSKNDGCDHNKDFDEDLDPYSSDHFRMYEFKVRRCTRSRSHDWTDCPFAHPGEKARRRDPRNYHYSGAVCPEFRRGGCSRGDGCEFSHGVFECWLHPSRYRTEACKDGRNCKRKVCFFAHSPRQLRILPEVSSSSCSSSPLYRGHGGGGGCLACHSVISSPTSTLLGMSHISPPLSPSPSPPLSPVKHYGFSRYSDRLSKLRSGLMSYKDVLNELMNSLEAMNFNEAAVAAAASPISVSATNPWIDNSCFNGYDNRQKLILSPSTQNPYGGIFNGDCSSKGFFDEKINVNDHSNGGVASLDPDLGWVNELLM